MSASLSILADYESGDSSDSSDSSQKLKENQAVRSILADYESGDGSDSSQKLKENQAVRRLPLPDSLKAVSKKEDAKDDPQKHDGRVRSYPHQRGNWNSLIYIPYQKNAPFDLFCDQIIEICWPLVEMKLIEEPHISLTRTFILLYHWIDNFVMSVKKSLQTFLRFDVQFDGLRVYCNEERSRTFLALSVGFGKVEIIKSVQLLDRCLSEYNISPFYKEASFHMSIIWCLGDRTKELEALLPDINKVFEANLNESLDLTIPVTEYICKIGHKIYNISLM